MRIRPLLCALLALLAACGGGEPPARVRLWTDAAVELVESPRQVKAETVFRSRFEDGLEGWRAIVNPGRGPGGLEARVESEDGRTFVRTTGAHGGLLARVPVEPGTCYVFRGAVRASGLELAGESFDGARFWLGESSEDAPFEELRTTRSALMTSTWSSPSAHGRDGWLEVRRSFVTTARTGFLHVVCSLATYDDLAAGSADFADLVLERRAPDEHWRELLAAETGARAAIDPPGSAGLRARRVSAELGGEHRPSLVLLPGDRLRFDLAGAAEPSRLSFGVGAWRPLVEGLGGRSTLRVRAGDRERTLSLDVPALEAEARWEPCEVRLDGARELELSLEGEAPLVVGAPVVATGAPSPEGPNVLLVSIDTLRADRVGAYGYGTGTTPTLDRLARAGLLCRDASAQSPYTLPSHATLLTGQFPSVHGAVKHERTLSAARSTTLAEILGAAGFATQAFTAGGFVNAEFGLDRGFEGFAQIDPIREVDSHYFRTLSKKHGEETATRLLEEHGFAAVERWLRAREQGRFFLFLHTYTVHDYDAPRRFQPCDELGCARPPVPLRTRTEEEAADYTPAMRAHVQHLYDAALRYTDERLGTLLATMDGLGLLEETLIVVTSDHGEEFFEHGALQHGRTLYEELLAIPLVVAGPGVAPRELERPAMLVDVVPTVLARLGLPRAPRAQGVDLLGPRWASRPIWSEVDDRFAHKYALRDERGRKAIHGPATAGIQFPNARSWEHFDLAADPREQRPLGEDERLASERRALEDYRRALEELGASLGAPAEGEVEQGTIDDLEELGYGGD